jgi:hypothetical protein
MLGFGAFVIVVGTVRALAEPGDLVAAIGIAAFGTALALVASLPGKPRGTTPSAEEDIDGRPGAEAMFAHQGADRFVGGIAMLCMGIAGAAIAISPQSFDRFPPTITRAFSLAILLLFGGGGIALIVRRRSVTLTSEYVLVRNLLGFARLPWPSIVRASSRSVMGNPLLDLETAGPVNLSVAWRLSTRLGRLTEAWVPAPSRLRSPGCPIQSDWSKRSGRASRIPINAPCSGP